MFWYRKPSDVYPTYATRRLASNIYADDGTDGQRTNYVDETDDGTDDGTDGLTHGRGRTDRGRTTTTDDDDGTDGKDIQHLAKSISMVYPSKSTRTDTSGLATKSVRIFSCKSSIFIYTKLDGKDDNWSAQTGSAVAA